MDNTNKEKFIISVVGKLMEVYNNISAQSVRNMIEYELRDYGVS